MTTKLKYGLSEITLDYPIIKPDYSYPLVIQKNPLTGQKYFKNVKFYDTFIIEDWLFKYNDRQAKLEEIEALKGQRVYFQPEFKSDYIQSLTNSAYIYFYVIAVQPYTIENSDIDYLVIRLASEQYLNQAGYTLIVDEDGNTILEEDLGELGFIVEE